MRAIILFSGGLDSTLLLAMAIKQGRECITLSFDYGQRHCCELKAAKEIASYYNVEHRIIKISPEAFGRSSLVTDLMPLTNRTKEEMATNGIPNTYVPARNTLFLAYAMGQAELLNAEEIYFGCNLLDRNPYVDCRPEYLQAIQGVMNLATQQAVEGKAPTLVTPLINWDKERIAKEALAIGVPIEKTWSCYAPTDQLLPCGVCDACVLRREALENQMN